MKWHLAFKADLANFRARVLEPETILGQGSAKFNYKSDNADWVPRTGTGSSCPPSGWSSGWCSTPRRTASR